MEFFFSPSFCFVFLPSRSMNYSYAVRFVLFLGFEWASGSDAETGGRLLAVDLRILGQTFHLNPIRFHHTLSYRSLSVCEILFPDLILILWVLSIVTGNGRDFRFRVYILFPFFDISQNSSYSSVLAITDSSCFGSGLLRFGFCIVAFDTFSFF